MAVIGKGVGPPSGLQLRAYHEAGHAVAALLKGFSLITISRRGRSGGACEYQFRIPRARARSAERRLARAGAAVALAGSVVQDGAAAERGWMAVDEATARRSVPSRRGPRTTRGSRCASRAVCAAPGKPSAPSSA